MAKTQPNDLSLVDSNTSHNQMLSKEADKSTNPESFGVNADLRETDC